MSSPHRGRSRIHSVAFAVFAAVLTPSVARAELLSIGFTGTVDSVAASLAGTFSVGQSIVGSYVFESTTAPRAGGTSAGAVYDALTHLDFTIGAYSASSTTSVKPEIQVANDADRYAVLSRVFDGLTGPDVAGIPLNSFGFRLDDSTNSAITDALVIPTSIDAMSFDNRQFFVFFANGDLVSGTLNFFTPTAVVPEPSSLALATISAVVGFGLWWRRRR